MPSTKSDRKKTVSANGQEETLSLVPRAGSLLKQVNDPTRLQVLLALADGKKSLCQISERLGRSEEESGYHLALLCTSHMVDSHWEGYEASYDLTEPGARFVDSILRLLEQAGPSPKPVLTKSQWKKLVKEVSSADDRPVDWLNVPNPQFERRRPLDLIGTDDEVRVHIIIGAARAGFFA
ncbi:MAG TPA: ArsR family transcriptional regulator [Isosphaeraceae bacterium]|nr:ArsR family transcriptional regulator [Isosphaeraceae bacterium]